MVFGQKVIYFFSFLFWSLSYDFSHLILGCIAGEFLNGTQCLKCLLGTYQDSQFHKKNICQGCSVTENQIAVEAQKFIIVEKLMASMVIILS